MFSIEKCPVPANTMLDKYLVNGAYTDCYMTEISGQVHFSEFILLGLTQNWVVDEQAKSR